MELKNCAQCNGTLRFNRERNLYICLYCDSEFKPPKSVKGKKGINIGGVNINIDGLDDDDINILNLDGLKINKAAIGSFVKSTLIVAGVLAVIIIGVAIYFVSGNLGTAMDDLSRAVGGTDNRPQAVQSAATASQSGDIVHTIDEEIVFEELTVTLNSVIFRRGGIFDDAADGMQYVAFKLTIENTSDTDRTFSSSRFSVFADNVRMNFNARATRNFTGSLGGAISPGRIIVGYDGYMIPLEAMELSVEIPSHIGGRNEMATITFQILNHGEQLSTVSVVISAAETTAIETAVTQPITIATQEAEPDAEEVVTRETYALLQYGMSIEEVQQLFGIPPFSEASSESFVGNTFTIKIWASGWNSITVTFTNGYLTDVSAMFL
ncbi:MAG: DUF4352 domain-containing protein [Defluviitaleaceae bacterium]|nr:DUF4352 domain-containing protein [Defluviitaleaceae bacterium]